MFYYWFQYGNKISWHFTFCLEKLGYWQDFVYDNALYFTSEHLNVGVIPLFDTWFVHFCNRMNAFLRFYQLILVKDLAEYYTTSKKSQKFDSFIKAKLRETRQIQACPCQASSRFYTSYELQTRPESPLWPGWNCQEQDASFHFFVRWTMKLNQRLRLGIMISVIMAKCLNVRLLKIFWIWILFTDSIIFRVCDIDK